MDRKEAIEIVKNTILYNSCSQRVREALVTLIPEFKAREEEEQHRKWILEYLYDGLRKSDEQFKNQFKHAIAWLEKQGENEHTWSKEDEKMIDDIRDEIYPYGECPDYPTDEERKVYKKIDDKQLSIAL